MTVDAVEEGTVIFPYEPLVRVTGPIWQAQLLESALLNIVNFQTLIATKAARICHAAYPDPVIEFGLRRAQGSDGALTASRAAYIGGCEATSNVLAGKRYGIPVKGTHAHSWVMSFDDERESFQSYAEIMPGNCIFLIDTYDSIKGAKKAIDVALELEKKGGRALGVRLDSGDLATISAKVRSMLDDAGLHYMKIIASNDLDENIIKDLKLQGAKIDVWGVGTSLVTGKDQPALDGVYKLSMIEERGGWSHRLKISEQLMKITNPGILQTRRVYKNDKAYADIIYDIEGTNSQTIIDPLNPTNEFSIEPHLEYEDLLVPVFSKGELVYTPPSIEVTRRKAMSQLKLFDPSVKRFLNPHNYFVGLEKNLYNNKMNLIQRLKDASPSYC